MRRENTTGEMGLSATRLKEITRIKLEYISINYQLVAMATIIGKFRESNFFCFFISTRRPLNKTHLL